MGAVHVLHTTGNRVDGVLLSSSCLVGEHGLRLYCTRSGVFAGLDALEPCVIKLRVAGISTVLEPTASATATRALAGFVGGALGTCDRGKSSCNSGCPGCCCARIGIGK